MINMIHKKIISTMKKMITVTSQVEVDITLPFYGNDGLHFYRIDEVGCTAVKNNKIFTSIEWVENYPQSWLDSTPCTEDEFLKVYANANSELVLLYHKHFTKPNAFINAQCERSGEND